MQQIIQQLQKKEEGHILIQSDTGTGKTYSYLIAVLEFISKYMTTDGQSIFNPTPVQDLIENEGLELVDITPPKDS